MQLEEGLANINNVERTMEFTGMSVLFVGGEDDEKQIDTEILAGIKGGIAGVINELRYEYVPDPLTGKIIHVKNEEMVKITEEILAINRIIREQWSKF